MSGGDARKTARNRIKPSTSTVSGEDHRELRNRKVLRKERGKDQLRILDVNFKLLLGLTVVSSLVALFFIFHSVQFADGDDRLPRVITPFPAPKIMDLEMFQGEHKESLYWGTYRPHLYFGVRARTPKSLVAGLMWLGVKDGRYFMRHFCQDADDLQTYGWNKHNGRDFGHQILIDHGMTLTTSFLKSKVDGSGYGGDWAFRVGVQSEKLNEEMPGSAHLFFYVADEGENALSLGRSVTAIHEKSMLAFGSRLDVGGWELHLKSSDDFEVHHVGLKTPHIHNLSDMVQGILALQVRNFGHLELPDTSDNSPNILVYQISATTPFRADIAFVTGTDIDDAKVEERVNGLTGTSLTNQLHKKENEFDDKFKKIFNQSDKLDSEFAEVGKAAIGNLLGGIGYFYGQSKILFPQPSKQHRSGGDSILYWPAELYTAVPSRPFFPRGFLWDEGFHQLLIWRWDMHISLDIIGHWLDLMNIDGWIPREQILGAEALSKVPEEFVAQRPSNGNPPTLFLVLQDVVCGVMRNKFSATESKEISVFFERSFGRLEAWFQWFNTTQSGKHRSSYYWHGRKESQTIFELNPKTLSSGLDDYPRASHPTEEERHLDLRCWMLLAADCMHSILEQLVKKKESGKAYGETAKLLADFDLLNKMHFDKDYGAYLDYGNHTEKVRLRRQLVEKDGNVPSLELVREVLEKPSLGLVPHIGYVSLFPFIWKIIPSKSWILEKQLDIISNTSILWTNYGLRSLSKTSSMYMRRNTEHDPPYWRGPIWMNMNYLILSSLHYYSKEEGPYRERAGTIYDELRSNLIRNVMKNHKQTGYLWEQYDQKKGNGKGAHPFTGWTSLVLLIMAESYSEC
ncbi:mannosyl-oligosaccharide glucosidase GCS1-like isoform X1 [Cynara cardunculus var. scolymus]|uniref:mannosyl-oligosaccharide glucosidase GCS1-like isoform X1 n=1 Tax=Cynara cardunculus var. scolymus TaxID=59895 RepID=UPI000D62A86B|nr:mannosyl-oligosaccharide glucosidase GCS1-like isoform X1 [Cynara cardunculus var. scolymus]